MWGFARRYLCAAAIAVVLAAAALASAPSTAHASGGGGARPLKQTMILPPPVRSLVLTLRVYELLIAGLYQQVILANLPLNPLAGGLHAGDPAAFTQARGESQSAKGPSMPGTAHAAAPEDEGAPGEGESGSDQPSPEDENSIVLLPLDEIRKRAMENERWVSTEELAALTGSYGY